MDRVVSSFRTVSHHSDRWESTWNEETKQRNTSLFDANRNRESEMSRMKSNWNERQLDYWKNKEWFKWEIIRLWIEWRVIKKKIYY